MELTGKSLKKKGFRQRLLAGALALTLGIGMTAVWPLSVRAAEEGTYLVTIVPSYKDPETGNIEDPGNNEAIGQGMTERMCGSTALLEVDSSGTMYLTVRYFLSQFINNVTFEERDGGSFKELSYKEVQSKEAVEGASDIADKYGYTDYRMKITSLDSVYRGKAFIIPAGRNVIFFFTAKNPVAGSGDFVTSKTKESVVKEKEPLNELQADENLEEVSDEKSDKEVFALDVEEEEVGNGSGKADDPVTGIPEKPSFKKTVKKDSQNQKDEELSYHLDTSYDLSQVPIEEARKQTEQMISDAVGIVKVTGADSKESQERSEEPKDDGGNKNVMMGLFGVSAVLVVYMGLGSLRQRQGDRR
jgi:hypothetical protein